jgi:photosystem II stability/assembly factor-like uncharacterized protein
MGSMVGWVRGVRAAGLALVAAAALAACGGGGGGDESDTQPDPPTVPTVLPASLAIDAPTRPQDLATAVELASNAVDGNRKLTYAWAFGDGATSTLAAPSHAWSKPGEYRLSLTVTNEAGESRTASGTVRVGDLSVVRGKSCSGGSELGWCWQRPLPQGNTINDTVFFDELRGWAVGEAGTILATTDGGVTWQVQRSGTQNRLEKVAFADTQNGWVLGTYGEVLRTADGGATWQSFSIGRADSAQTFGASDASNAWLTTYNGAMVTSDGGAHWESISLSSPYVQLLTVSSVNNLWGLAYVNGAYALSRSSDRGRTWTPLPLPPAESGFNRSSQRVQFTTPSTGFVAFEDYGWFGSTYQSRLFAYQTVDGGASWQRLELAGSNASLYNSGLQVVAGAAYVLSDSRQLRRTVDRGATWQPLVLPTITSGYWSSYRAYSASRLTLTSSLGRTFLSTDGGATWNDRSAGAGSLPDVASIWFFDRREGVAYGQDGSSSRTSDGGQSWSTTLPSSPPGYYGWQRVQFSPSGSVGWVTGSVGIYRSTDRGRTWLAPAPETSARLPSATDFHFVDDSNGWAVSSNSSPEPIYRTTDGGMSWKAVPGTANVVNARAIRFADTMNGVLVGAPGVAWVTVDGGVTWTPRPTGVGTTLHRVAFADTTTVVAVGSGGMILRSTDRGLNWTRAGSPTTQNLNELRFVSATVGYAVGDGGTLIKTADAGLTWTNQSTPTTQRLNALYLADEHTGWVGGGNGTILATASGGR